MKLKTARFVIEFDQTAQVFEVFDSSFHHLEGVFNTYREALTHAKSLEDNLVVLDFPFEDAGNGMTRDTKTGFVFFG